MAYIKRTFDAQQGELNFLWFDYETTGLDKFFDRPVQFAAIRTDKELNIIDEPVNLLCQLAPDVLPSPQACAITGVTPSLLAEKGLSEYEFAQKILALFKVPQTCGVGYNSLRFDDEITRTMAFRHFFNPYEREWKNGNSRWDILHLIRATYAFRRDALNWPVDDKGRVTMRLELLADANGLSKVQAHDALSDVRTTIDLARAIKKKAPELFHHYVEMRKHQVVASKMSTLQPRPFFLVDNQKGPEGSYLSCMAPVVAHPVQNKAVICVDVMKDPKAWLHLSAASIAEHLFRPWQERKPDEEEWGIKVIYQNRSPFVATFEDVKTMGLRAPGENFDKALMATHWKVLQDNALDIASKLREVYALSERAYLNEDAESSLYSGFSSKSDESNMSRFHVLSNEEKGSIEFESGTLNTLLWRWRARSAPGTLNEEEKERWSEEVRQRLWNGQSAARTFKAVFEEAEKWMQEHPEDKVVPQWQAYYKEKAAEFPQPPSAHPKP